MLLCSCCEGVTTGLKTPLGDVAGTLKVMPERGSGNFCCLPEMALIEWDTVF